jgi:drug/metabolite transporter (DMT)-like permease
MVLVGAGRALALRSEGVRPSDLAAAAKKQLTRHDPATITQMRPTVRPVSTRAPATLLTGPLGIALLVLAWSSTFTATKIGLEDAPPLLFGGLRTLLGGLVVAVIAWTRAGPPDLRRTWPVHTVLGFWNVIVFFALQTLAILALPSGLAAVLIYLQPLLVAVLAWRLLGESMSVAKVAGLLVGFGGIVLVSTGALDGHISGEGVAYAVLGALVWAIGTIAFKRRQDRVDQLWAVAVPFVGGGVVLTLVGALSEGVDIAWTGRFVVALAYASLAGSALAWGLWFGLVASGEASRASSYIFLVPVVAVLLGVVLLDEEFRLVQAAGSVLVVAGLYLVNRRPII